MKQADHKYENEVTMYKELDGIVADQVVGLSWNATSTRLAIVGDKSKGCVWCLVSSARTRAHFDAALQWLRGGRARVVATRGKLSCGHVRLRCCHVQSRW